MRPNFLVAARTILHRSGHGPVQRTMQRQLSASTALPSSLNEKFTTAQMKLREIGDQENDVRLKLYGLFKQSTIGKNTTTKPGALDVVGRARWEAWNAVGDISQEEAQKLYVEFVQRLVEPKGNSVTVSGITVDVKDGVRLITLNRPEKRNALTKKMYMSVIDALIESNTDDSTRIVAMTGAGEYFCSGTDHTNFANVTITKAFAEEAGALCQKYVAAYIDCKKPLVALVNGPALGIGCTVLGLADAVYATDVATFITPFSATGQSPEGCSSYTFPRIMGSAKANEMLMFNAKLSAQQALTCGFVTELFPHQTFHEETRKRLEAHAQLPPKALIYMKGLVRGWDREILHSVNEAECKLLAERWQSEDFMNAITKFFSRKK